MTIRPAILVRSIASLFLLTGTSPAITWNGSTSGDWNTGTNWDGGTVPGPGQDANIFSIGGNIPTISADIISIPTDIRVGQFNGANGQLNQTAGLASTGNGNWMTVGAGTGSIGLYNLANVSTTGGTLTGFGLGSGSMTVAGSNLWVGGTGNEAGGTGTVNINTTGSLNVGNELHVGANGGNGTMKMDAGTINSNGEVFVGLGANSTGAIVISGGTVKINSWLNVGRDNGTGSVTMTGGTMNVQRQVRIGWGAGGNGTLNLSGGAILQGGTVPGTTDTVDIGDNGGTGSATISGAGTLLFSTSELHIGNTANATGTMVVSGGTVSSAGWMAVGRLGSTGTLTVSGTGVVSQGAIDLGSAFELTNNNQPSTATVNLNGGTLLVNRVVNNGGPTSNTNLSFDSGTLKARVDSGDFMQGLTSVTIKAGGAKFDTNGHNVTVSQPLLTDAVSTGGGLIKNGAGTLALNAAETYTGATIVNSGRLQLNPNGNIATSSGIVVNGGRGALVSPNDGGSAILPGAVFTVQNDGIASSNAIGTSTVTLNGGTLEYHGGQGSGFAVNTVNVVTSGALAAQPQSGGGLMAVNNLQRNASGTVTFISTYGNIGSGDNTADVGHVSIATVNGSPIADIVTAQHGVIGGWATTFSTNNNADTASHFATYGANGVQAVTYDGGDITTALDTHNIRSTGQQTVSVNKTINSLESVDGDISIDGGTTLTIATGGLIIGGSSHWIKEGTGAGAITAGALSGNQLFATVNDASTDYRIHEVSVTNNGATAIGFVKAGAGLLSMDATNTYTGATKINAGILKFNRVASLYNGNVASWTPANITVNSGGTVAFNVGGAGEFSAGNVTTLLTNLSTVADNGLKADTSIGFDTSNLVAGGAFTIADTLKDSTGTGGGSIGITKLGANTLVLSAANTYTGGTRVLGGTLQVSGTGTLGTATNALTIAADATVDLNGTSQSVGALNGNGAVVNNLSTASTLTINNELTGGNFAGTINNGVGAVALVKTGDGIQILSGANTYTGTTTINSGTLKAGASTATNTSGSLGVNSAIVLGVNGAAVLDIAGFDTQVGSLAGGGSNSSRILIGGATLTTGADNSSTTFAGVITGSGALVKIGTGTQNLSNSSNHTGGTTVNAGTLQLSYGSDVGTLAGDGPIVVNSGATLAGGAVDALGHDKHTVNNTLTLNEGATLTTLAGGRLSMDRDLFSIGGTITSVGTSFDNDASYNLRSNGATYNFTSSTSGTASLFSATHIGVNNAIFNVTKGGGAVDLNVTGDIVDKFGNGGLTKTGNGVMVIAALNNPLLTGATIVNEGTLLVTGGITGSAVTVNGGTLGGNGGTLGSTIINAGGILAPGPSIGTLNFASSLTLAGTALFEINKTGSLLTADLANVTAGSLTLGGNLTVTATGNTLAFGDSFDLFNSTEAFQGSFATVNLPSLSAGLSWDTSNLGVNGTLAVVPEPGTAFSLFAGIGMLLGLRRRRSVK